MASLIDHHLPEERLTGLEALSVHTLGSFALARTRSPRRGQMAPDIHSPADLAWLDRDPVTATVEDLLATRVLGTWIRGVRVWPQGEAEAP
jgi:predicted amidohydrolase YtcJ